MKAIEEESYLWKGRTALDEQVSSLIEHISRFASITTEYFYVLDILRDQFYYIKPKNHFLNDYLVGENMDFYTKTVYPEDLSLCVEMRQVILRYLRNSKDKKNEIDYFSCVFRLQCSYSFLIRSLPQMVFFRMVPFEVDGEFRYLICTLGSSTAKDAGDLRIYSKDGLTYEAYNFKTKRWKQKTIVSLTEREEAILMLAGQGKSVKEIADDLYKGHYTIRNQIKQLFSKLEVHSMQEAIELACYHRISYPKPNKEAQPVMSWQAAGLEDVAESAIEYRRDKEWLEK